MNDNITLPRQTVQQALEALEGWWDNFPESRDLHDKVAITALRTALEQIDHRTMIFAHRRTEARIREIHAGRKRPHDVEVMAL